jgi:hypothetical protein
LSDPAGIVIVMAETVSSIVEQVAQLHDRIDDIVAGASVPADPNDRNDDRLRHLVVGLERVRNAAEAVQADAMVAMGAEARVLDSIERNATNRPSRSHEEFVPDEIAVLLSCTKTAASMRYGIAVQALRYPAVTEGWRNGSIDGRKVSVIADHLQYLDPAVADELAGPAVHHASERTSSQTREWLRRRVISIDPDAAESRRQDALSSRRVVITPAEDGMSELWAWLPSARARQIQQTLTQLAHAVGSDDARTMDQRRADALADVLVGQQSSTPVALHVVAPIESLTGACDQPAWIPGAGPITAPEARSLLSGAESLTVLLTDTRTGTIASVVGLAEQQYRPSAELDRAVRARDVTCRFPGCRRSASGSHSGTDLDHTIPWPEGSTSPDNLAVLCRRHHRLKHCAGWNVTLHPDGSMTWVTPSGRNYQTYPWEYADPPDTGPDVSPDVSPHDRE